MFLIPLQTENKQILRRWAPQNDIATSPQGDGRQAHPQPNFQRRRRVRRVRSIFNKDSLLGVLRASAVNIRTLFDCARILQAAKIFKRSSRTKITGKFCSPLFILHRRLKG